MKWKTGCFIEDIDRETAWRIGRGLLGGGGRLEFDGGRARYGDGVHAWRVPGTNAYMVDLGVRLEVNRENGETINIYYPKAVKHA